MLLFVMLDYGGVDTHSSLFNRCSDRVQFDSSIIAPICASSLAYVRLGIIVRALVWSICMCVCVCVYIYMYVCLTSLPKHEFTSLHNFFSWSLIVTDVPFHGCLCQTAL